MSVEVYIYDTQCKVLPQQLDATVFDTTHTILTSGQTQQLSAGNWGITLSWTASSATANAYELLLDDPGTTYAPFNIDALNGNHTGRIDAVIKKLPAGGHIASTVGTAAQALAAIRAQGTWTPDEKIALTLFVTTFSHFKHGRYDPVFWQRFLGRWRVVLDRYGIPDTLL